MIPLYSVEIWGKVRTNGELLSPALRDKARGQNVKAFAHAVGRFPHTRVRITHGKCFVYIGNREYDIDKLRKPNKQALFLSLLETGA